MDNEYSLPFTIIGIANEVIQDSGLTSPETETRRVKQINIYVPEHKGNQIVVYLDREQLKNEFDFQFITDESTGSTNTQKNTNRLNHIEINRQVPKGSTLACALACGANAYTIYGSYVYTIV